jgi:Galactose oxidase, central domain/Kelch motif
MSRLLASLLVFSLSFLSSTQISPSASISSSPRSISRGPQMLEPRSGHTATLLPDGKVLIAGGMRRNQDFFRSAELFNPKTGKFEATGEMHRARVGHAAVLLRSGKVLIAGGWMEGSGPTDTAELYDPATGKFSDIASLPARVAHPSATLLLNGNVLLAGGAEGGGPEGISSAAIFDSRTLSFHSTGRMHFARFAHTASLLKDGRVLVVGGRGERVTNTAEIYDPKSGSFSLTGSMNTARYKHTAGVMPDGRVLVAGGSDERDWRGNLASAEIYDPHTGRFAAASPLTDARFKLPEQAVTLSSGGLLIAGGSHRAEIFDPRLQRFTLVPGDMDDARHYMSETQLVDGRVLLAGGYYNDDRATTQTWVFTP